eukprot:CAMPEP_0206022654 /NCGR_PEP_ID=MMETSP1464-20131121/35091_1 /ASSEMBLY_ACC=CAM_ASM_001124 /TAXON_ID=119497 /ORGANISM="Exanthemachrysis gayraliae, Strain RCC1523" /LENGTH=218 /DNA_ID=CAMNT_0053396623 /DNA_START=521 /DNA_END=1175 /DNA_ORIENTATION=-
MRRSSAVRERRPLSGRLHDRARAMRAQASLRESPAERPALRAAILWRVIAGAAPGRAPPPAAAPAPGGEHVQADEQERDPRGGEHEEEDGGHEAVDRGHLLGGELHHGHAGDSHLDVLNGQEFGHGVQGALGLHALGALRAGARARRRVHTLHIRACGASGHLRGRAALGLAPGAGDGARVVVGDDLAVHDAHHGARVRCLSARRSGLQRAGSIDGVR